MDITIRAHERLRFLVNDRYGLVDSANDLIRSTSQDGLFDGGPPLRSHDDEADTVLLDVVLDFVMHDAVRDGGYTIDAHLFGCLGDLANDFLALLVVPFALVLLFTRYRFDATLEFLDDAQYVDCRAEFGSEIEASLYRVGRLFAPVGRNEYSIVHFRTPWQGIVAVD